MLSQSLLTAAVAAATAFAQPRPVDYVNPLIGTAPFEDKQYLGGNPPKGEELYTGTVVPGAMVPDGVVKLSPDTGFDGIYHVRGSSYRYTDASIMGFSHTHHEYNRFANILFMPVVGPVKTKPGSRENPGEGYRSRKDPQRERATPGYYTVFLSDYGVTAELTATKNAGFHRYTFPKSDKAHILIDLASAQNSNRVEEASVQAIGKQAVEGWQKCKGFTVYFHAEFNKPFASFGTWKQDELHPGVSTQTGHPIGAFVDFKTAGQEAVLAKVGISFVDLETAKQNLQREIPAWDFDGVRKQASDSWNNLLKAVEVEGGAEGERINFYTSLYRVLASDLFLSWPVGGSLQTIIRRDWLAERLAQAKWTVGKSGFWGPGQASWLMGAYTRGLRNFDVAAAYEALRRGATDPKVGWERLSDYLRYGYITTDASTTAGPIDSVPNRPDVVNRTLGYAYEDYCIAQLAKALGRDKDYEYFMARSGNYRLVFDPLTGFMRGRRPDSTWAVPFDPSAPYAQSFYREGTAWHYLWLVPHDIEGLINLLGGRAAFIRKLDEFFTLPYQPKEPMRDITGVIGQYVHGNETDRHAPYLYNYAGAPWKTQEIVRKIMRELHKPTPAGLCGMDDNGYLTGWYAYSAMGFYPVEPASGIYVIGSPAFTKTTIQVHGGKFVIEAHNASPENIYIQSATLNGKPLNRPYFHYSEMSPGGNLVFEMGSKPNKSWGASPDAAPPSVTPVFETAQAASSPQLFAPVSAKLVDPKATEEARALMSRLAADYGKRSWSALKLTGDVPFLQENTGKKPVIISGDFMSYSPSRIEHGSDPKNHTEEMVALHEQGYVNAMDWHWNAPTRLLDTPQQKWTSGFMTPASTYDIGLALANMDSPEYACLLRDMDAIALQLRKFSDAKIPVLWRPLHEADGRWFWWGARGPVPFARLWRLLYTRFTEHHGLHNLIWVYTPANPARDEWYPGDDVVDIVGLDAYPKDQADTLAEKWNDLQARYRGKKLLALTEFGGVPDIEAMHKAGVRWSYFSSWNKTLNKTPLETVIRTYRSPVVVTLGEAAR